MSEECEGLSQNQCPTHLRWSRPKMLQALQEMLPYLTDTDLLQATDWISEVQFKRKKIQT